MFTKNKNKIVELELEIKKLLEKNNKLSKDNISENNLEQKKFSLNEEKKDLDRDRKEFDKEKANLEVEVERLVKIKISELTDQINDLKVEKKVSEKEATMLRKAFENLGFDVKDMKGILDKLVDGLIAKNQIKLVK